MQQQRQSTREGVSAWVIAAVMAMLICSAFAAFSLLQSTRRSATDALGRVAHTRSIELHSANLVQALADAQNAMRDYAAGHDQRDLDAYVAGRQSALTESQTLDQMTSAAPQLREAFLTASADYGAAMAAIDQAIAQARARRPSHAQSAATQKILVARLSAETLQQQAHAQGIAADATVSNQRARIDRQLNFLAGLFLATIAFTLLWVYSERRALQRVARRLRETNADLDSARRRAEEADTAKSRFLALASHDMRQPLHAITLYLAALRRRVEGDQAKTIVANMDMAAQSLTRMFSGLLDLARIESGVLSATPAAFPLQEAFDAVAQEAAVDARAAKVELRVVPTSLIVFSDRELLESILRNLLTNAFKYAPDGRVLMGCRRLGGYVRVEVRDEGPGIPKDKRVMVFGEFVRLDQSKGVEGLGLGLSIASRLANLLGGELAIDSRQTKGACFYVKLPLAETHAPAAAETPSPAPVALAGVRIALKDDEPLALAAMARVLTDAGAKVSAYGDAKSFVNDVAAGKQYDLVIGDPVLLRESRIAGALDDDVRPPVIVLTGATDPGSLEAFRAAKVELLIKPVPEDVLLATASRVARERALATQS